MHMKQSRKIIHRKVKITPANRIFSLCFPLILLCLFGVIAELSAQKELSAGAAAYYRGMMEYPTAALALLTAGVYLAELVTKRKNDLTLCDRVSKRNASRAARVPFFRFS